MEKRTFLASADGRRWLWDNWKGFILEGILKLTYLATGPWLWIASYGPVRNCIVQSQRKMRTLHGEERGTRGMNFSHCNLTLQSKNGREQ